MANHGILKNHSVLKNHGVIEHYRMIPEQRTVAANESGVAQQVQDAPKRSKPWLSIYLPITFTLGMGFGTYFHALIQEEDSSYRQNAIQVLTMENALLEQKALLAETLLGLYTDPENVNKVNAVSAVLDQLNSTNQLQVARSGEDFTVIRFSGENYQVPFRWKID